MGVTAIKKIGLTCVQVQSRTFFVSKIIFIRLQYDAGTDLFCLGYYSSVAYYMVLSGSYSYTTADSLQHNNTLKAQVLSKELFSDKGSTTSSASSFEKKAKKRKKSATNKNKATSNVSWYYLSCKKDTALSMRMCKKCNVAS